MNHTKNVLLIISIAATLFLGIHMTQSTSLASYQLFHDKPNANLYWQALIEIAKNNKPQALETIALIRSGQQGSDNKNNNTLTIDDFFDELFIMYVASSPQFLTQLGLFESIGINEHNTYLDNVSPQALIEDFNDKKRAFQKLQTFDVNKLNPNHKLSYDIFYWLLKHEADGEKFLFHEYKITQLSGILSNLTMLFTQFHRLDTVEDVELYIMRLGKIPQQINQTIALLHHQEKLGIVPPTFTIKKVINSINDLTPLAITNNILYAHLTEKIQKVDMQDKDRFTKQAQIIIEQQVNPAFQKLRAYFEHLLALYHTQHGVWALPDGDAYYQHMLEFHTTTHLTADEIHELGIEQVRAIHQEIRTIFARLGMNDPDKTVSQLLLELAKDPQFYYPQTSQGILQCLEDFKAIAQRSKNELYPLFDIRPTSTLTIQAVPQHEEEGQPSAYYVSPSMDGTRPGTFFVNVRNMKEIQRYEMETLTVHEAEPGHHFQIALQQEMDLPILRKIDSDAFTAYIEGWALYVEKLAYEHNFYSSHYSQIGHFQDELLRAARLVVDTGIHKKRWTREQAIEYMEQATGYNHDSIITEVERYFVLPGQACSYKIGQLKILELRKKAKDALDDRFDIKEFHNIILKTGSVPVSVLETVVDRYIQDKKGT